MPSPLQNGNQPFQANTMMPPDTRREAAIDPTLSQDPPNRPERVQELGYKEAVEAWSRFRFVRAGWFTPSEAIDYID